MFESVVHISKQSCNDKLENRAIEGFLVGYYKRVAYHFLNLETGVIVKFKDFQIVE